MLCVEFLRALSIEDTRNFGGYIHEETLSETFQRGKEMVVVSHDERRMSVGRLRGKRDILSCAFQMLITKVPIADIW
jgi:hypothetical protein